MKKFITYIIVFMMIFPTAYAYEDTAYIGNRIAREAANWLGTPYGVSDGSGGYGTEVDCSGLVMQVYAAFGIQLPRTSMLQAQEGELIPLNEMISGDIVCFMYEDGSIGHVGIYIGGNTMIHSPRPRKNVEFSSYFEDWGNIKAVYGRRITAESMYTPPQLPDETEIKIAELLSTPNSLRTDHLTPDDTVLILRIDSPIMNVNGIDKLIDESGHVLPWIKNNRTLLPLRSIAEEFGAEVNWIGGNNGEISIKYKNTEIILWINSNIISVNGNIKYTDAVPVLVGGRAFLPIRAIADEFGWQVEWNGENRTITLSAPRDIF